MAASKSMAAAGPGLERVAAVRSAVVQAVQVLVDCHSRFDANTASMIAAGPGLERVAAVRSAVVQAVQVLVDCHSRFDANTASMIAAGPGLERVAAVRSAVVQAVQVLVDCHSRFDANTASMIAAGPGLERVAAVRSAVVQAVQVLVDCHSRFDANTASMIAADLMAQRVGWFEEPLQPTTDSEDLAHVAGEVGIPVAGGESGYGEAFFSSLVRFGAVSIVMPDVKYCGGVAEAYRAGIAAMEAGAQVSLHSPAGPVSQLASAHVAAAIPGALALEYAGNEVPWRADLLTPGERVENGRLWFPGGTALGASLNDDLVKRHGRRWTE